MTAWTHYWRVVGLETWATGSHVATSGDSTEVEFNILMGGKCNEAQALAVEIVKRTLEIHGVERVQVPWSDVSVSLALAVTARDTHQPAMIISTTES